MGPMVAPWDDRCKRDVNCARTIQSAADRNRFCLKSVTAGSLPLQG